MIAICSGALFYRLIALAIRVRQCAINCLVYLLQDSKRQPLNLNLIERLGESVLVRLGYSVAPHSAPSPAKSQEEQTLLGSTFLGARTTAPHHDPGTATAASQALTQKGHLRTVLQAMCTLIKVSLSLQ